MRRIKKSIQKNLKVLMRSKASALVVILGPLLLIVLVGLAFDNYNESQVRFGAYVHTSTPLVESYLDSLPPEIQVRLIGSEEACVEEIKEGSLHACMVFPEQFEINEGEDSEIILYVDYSRANLVWNILGTTTAQFGAKNDEISINLTEQLLNRLSKTQETIHNLDSEFEILAENSANMHTQADSTISTLSSIDTSFDKDAFAIDDLQNVISQENKNRENNAVIIQQMKRRVEDEITHTIAGIDDVSDAIGELDNVSSAVRNDLMDDLGNLEEELQDLSDYIESQNASTGNLETVSSMVGDIGLLLDDTEQQLKQIDQGHDAAIKIIEDLKKSFDVTLSHVSTIKGSLQEIDMTIASIQVRDVSTIVSPVSTRIRSVVPERSNLAYVFPSLVVFIIMFTSILLATTLIMMERKSPAAFRNRICPAPSGIFLASSFITTALVILLQIAFISIVSLLFFEGFIFSLPFVLGSLLITSFFTVVGMCVGLIFSSEETANLAAVSLSTVLLILSNTVLPIERMPLTMMNIVRFNPFVISQTIMQKTIVFSVPLEIVQMPFLQLLAYSLLGLHILILVTLRTKLK